VSKSFIEQNAFLSKNLITHCGLVIGGSNIVEWINLVRALVPDCWVRQSFC